MGNDVTIGYGIRKVQKPRRAMAGCAVDVERADCGLHAAIPPGVRSVRCGWNEAPWYSNLRVGEQGTEALPDRRLPGSLLPT